jgi:hypothetical protein
VRVINTTWGDSAHAEFSVEDILEPTGAGTQDDFVGFETSLPGLGVPILNSDVRKNRRVRIPGYSLSVIDCVGLGLYLLVQIRLSRHSLAIPDTTVHLEDSVFQGLMVGVRSKRSAVTRDLCYVFTSTVWLLTA